MSTRRLVWLALLTLAGCPTSSPDGAARFDPPLVVASPGYCPALLERCPAASHPVTGVRAVVECGDPKTIIEHGWRTKASPGNARLPLIVGQCLQDGDCLVYCRLWASCRAEQVAASTLVCQAPTCGAKGCELDLGERRRCDGASSPSNCVECPADCPTSCADEVLEPGESCEPCTAGALDCAGDLLRTCRDDGLGHDTLDCNLNGFTCASGACVTRCGNRRCDSVETATSCPADCACMGSQTLCVGDEVFQCVSGKYELVDNCSSTGKACFFGACYVANVCGNTLCEMPGETHANCPTDCP